MYSIYVTTTVVSTCIALQEADKAYLSGVPLKESLSFLTSQERDAKENKVLFFKPGHIASILPLEDRCTTVLNSTFLLTTYGNKMCWLRLFQLVSQPVEVLVPPTDRILWQIKLCSCGLEKNRI